MVCPQNGLCDCHCVLNTSVYRYFSCIGPQTPVGFEDTAWVLSPGWKVFFDYSASPTYIDYYNNPASHWVRKMHPMRFRIDSLLSSFAGFGFSNIRTLFESLTFNIGHSTLTPPSSSHLRDLQVTGASFPLRGMWHNAYSTNLYWSTSVYVTHYRILVDGVDQTGVTAFSSPIPLSINTGVGVPNIYSAEPTDVLPFVAGPGQTVEIDFWVYIDTGGGPYETQGPGSSTRALCNIDYQSAFARADLKVNTRNISGSYELTFSSLGPEPSIVLESQSGWTYSSTAFSKTLSNAAWTLTLDWSGEYAKLLVTKVSENNVPSGASSVMRYYPADSSDYDGVEFTNGYIAKPGVWDWESTTVFSLRQRKLNTSAHATEGSDSVASSFFTAFPTSITVGKL
jgi:hypothetical protein